MNEVSCCNQLMPSAEHYLKQLALLEGIDITLYPVMHSEEPQGILHMHSNQVPAEPKILIYFLLH